MTPSPLEGRQRPFYAFFPGPLFSRSRNAFTRGSGYRAKGKLPVISPVSFKGLPCKLVVTADRAFRNIGEKAEEKCQSAEVMIRRCLPPVNIDHIAHR